MEITSFNNRCVQDLAWAIRSPTLIAGNIAGVSWWSAQHCAQEYLKCLPLLEKLDKKPEQLQQQLALAKSYRLGHYFEALVACWLKISPSYELLHDSYAIRDSNRTLGEIDFLIRDLATDKIIHLEVAIKFYLGYGNLQQMSNWHGPELRDRLDIKFKHLCEHQTQLSKHYPELMPRAVDERACLLKGRLFYPPNQLASTDFTQTDHLHGYWYEAQQHTETNDGRIDKSTGYIGLAKRNWLATCQPPYVELLPALPLQPDKPDCFAKIKNTAEQQRLFWLPVDFWSGLDRAERTCD